MCMITAAIVGGILNTIGQQRQLEEQEAQAEFYARQEAENARLARREAEAIGIMAQQEEKQLEMKRRAQLGSARVTYASSGVVLGSGVSADYEADIADAYGLDADNLRYDIESRQWQKRVAAANSADQGAMYQYQADNFAARKTPSLLSGVFSTIGSSVGAATSWLKLGA